MRTNQAMLHSMLANGYFKKNTALSKSQATAADRRGKEVQVF